MSKLFRRMNLVPEEEIERKSVRALHDYNPELRAILPVVAETKTLLKKRKYRRKLRGRVSLTEQIHRYRYAMQRLRTQLNQMKQTTALQPHSTPIQPPTMEAVAADSVTTSKTPMQRVGSAITQLPQKVRKKARQLVSWIERFPDEIQVDAQFKVLLSGGTNPIPNSNIIDLIRYAVLDRAPEAAGWQQFRAALTNINTPLAFIQKGRGFLPPGRFPTILRVYRDV